MILNNLIKNFVFIFFYLFVTYITYMTFTYVDYFDGSILIRVLMIGLVIVYFLILCRNFSILKTAKEKINKYPSVKKRGEVFLVFSFMAIHFLIVSYFTEKFNNSLLEGNFQETTAFIKDCHRGKGAEHCVYYYSVDYKNYEIKYSNEQDNYKFKEGDTVKVIYYPLNPVISRLK